MLVIIHSFFQAPKPSWPWRTQWLHDPHEQRICNINTSCLCLCNELIAFGEHLVFQHIQHHRSKRINLGGARLGHHIDAPYTNYLTASDDCFLESAVAGLACEEKAAKICQNELKMGQCVQKNCGIRQGIQSQ